MTVERALISVYFKEGLIDFAKGLQELGIELISTGGTAKHLREKGIKVIDVNAITGFPEVLDNRVKTLHPFIHAGILAKREPEHLKELEKLNIKPIDLVIVNFYPFQEKLKEGLPREKVIEFIDIGGPTMVRAAAKNSDYVAVITKKEQYNKVLNELKENDKELSLKTKHELAAEAFSLTALYDSLISSFYLNNFTEELFPEKLTLGFQKVNDLRYGENPHQKAALYKSLVLEPSSLLNSKIIQGKELSFNNYFDAEAAINIVKEFDEPAVSIIKHANPCGVAIDDDINIAFSQALESDSVSAFGSVIAMNRLCNKELAEKITSFFNEVVIAPEFDEKALEVFKRKPRVRLLELKALEEAKPSSELNFKKITSGLLLQENDVSNESINSFEVVTEKKPTEEELNDLMFAWKVVKHMKSNAILLAKHKATIGLGVGQTSRIDSVYLAIKKAGGREKNSVLASDGFFPFRDSIDAAAEAGIKAIVQPGGSIKDKEVIKAANEQEIAMLFTKTRHFKH